MNSLVTVAANRKVLLRIYSLSTTSFHTIESPGIPMRVVGRDARILRGGGVPSGLRREYLDQFRDAGGRRVDRRDPGHDRDQPSGSSGDLLPVLPGARSPEQQPGAARRDDDGDPRHAMSRRPSPSRTRRRRHGQSISHSSGRGFPPGGDGPPGRAPASAAIDGLVGNSFTIDAGTGYITGGDFNRIFFWGFADGNTGQVQYPGPTLIVNQGDTVTVTLRNNLPEPVSIVFPGMENVTASAGVRGRSPRRRRRGGPSRTRSPLPGRGRSPTTAGPTSTSRWRWGSSGRSSSAPPVTTRWTTPPGGPTTTTARCTTGSSCTS